MKQGVKCQRILILSLLSISVVTPIVFFSNRLADITLSFGHRDFAEDLSTLKHKTDSLKLNAIHQDIGRGLKVPEHVVYKAENIKTVVSDDAKRKTDANSLDQSGTNKNGSVPLDRKGYDKQTPTRESNKNPQPRRATDEKLREMKDQVIRAKAYLKFAPPNSNSHLVKDLRLRIKELERAIGEATKDSDLSRSAMQRMKSMESVLTKAGRIYTDCPSMTTKLRAMTYNAEEQVLSQKTQSNFLVHLASRTTPKGLHCLSMRLTTDYFALHPKSRLLPNQHKVQNPNLYHYTIFSDNILACSVVVNSTILSSQNPEKVVIHVVTDSLNLPSITMWFLLNPVNKATLEIKNVDDLNFKINVQESRDPRFSSKLNYLRFYLPEIFPKLKKIVFLDHDVVVQKDLKGLWSVEMEGKVNGAVMTCHQNDPSFHRMDTLINFADPFIAKRFDIKSCTWAFGVNLFDLDQWRKQNLTAVYNKYVEMGKKKQLWNGGSLPLGMVTFYNQTIGLDRRWHLLGLGYESGVGRGDVERAAVIHYDGTMKPWLEIGIGKYKGYWNRHVKYGHPYLQQCNIHD